MKRIVIGCDGTWNTPDQTDRGQRRPTNITKLLRAVLPTDDGGIDQVVYYDKGLGTHWGISRWIEGATGYGISDNIIEAYRFLCLNYAPGDEIYLLGFSRGAFTVRSLVGLVGTVGLLPKSNEYFTPEAYDLYRSKDNPSQFRQQYETLDVKIRFLGVFDTVGALGIPIGILNWLTASRHQFHRVGLGDNVDHAFHALALDERRRQFAPTLWKPDQAVPSTNMEQVWYVGVHTNIGGGYAPDGLANIPLHSMKNRMIKLGLQLDTEFLSHYKPNPEGMLRNSRKGLYRLTRTLERKTLASPNGNERIHTTVYERMDRDSTYKPPNVPKRK
ncbi:MAG: DUF2235 domain-containing protein [Sedimenticola sp.]